jgi:ATP-dependent helicase/nuclease subunit B
LLAHAVELLEAWSKQGQILFVGATRQATDVPAYQACGQAIVGLHRHTIDSLSRELADVALAKENLAPLSAIARDALSALVVDEAAPSLRHYSPIAKAPGFAPALSRTLEALRVNCISPPLLDTIGPSGRDLGLLLRAYEAELRERHLADTVTRLQAASQAMHHPLVGLPLILLDASPSNASERLLIKTLIDAAPRVVVLSLRFDSRGWEELLPCEPASCDNKITSALTSVQQHLLSGDTAPERVSDESFEVFSASSESLECMEIGREIIKAAEGGTPFDRIAVLLRSPEPYGAMIEEAFRRSEIPSWFSRGTQKPDPSGRAFLALLQCAAENVSANRFAEYLSLGVTPTDVVLPGNAERILVNSAVIGGKDRWQRRLFGFVQDLRALHDQADDDESRAQLHEQIVRAENLAAFAVPLITRLAALPKQGLWGDLLHALRLLATEALRKPDRVLAVLEELQPMAQIGPVPIDQVLRVLSGRLRKIWIDPADHPYGQVFVGVIEEARGMAFDLVFVPGVNEGSFPRTAAETDPLLDEECQRSLAFETHTDEAALFRIAAACATKQLKLSFSQLELVTGRARVPSFYIFEALKASGRDAVQIEREARKSETRLGWPAPLEPVDALDNAEYDLSKLRQITRDPSPSGKAAWLTKVNGHLVRALRARWHRWHAGWSRFDGLIHPEVEADGDLGKFGLRSHPYSASALQQFTRCPYRFALQAVHRIRPLYQPQPLHRMSQAIHGDIHHSVQFQTMRNLQAEGLLPVSQQNLAQAWEILDAVVSHVASEYAEKLRPAIQQIWQSEIEAIRTDLRGWLRHKALHDADWLPLYFELGFGRVGPNHDPLSSADPAELENGMLVFGSIDMIERHVGGALRVTDHKTGRVPQPLPTQVGGGEVLQPALYALAAEAILAPDTVKVARLSYSTLGQQYRNIDFPAHPRFRTAAVRVLDAINSAITRGWLPAAPRQDGCKACEYLPVCGPYEEERIKLKSKGELTELHQIRRMS